MYYNTRRLHQGLGQNAPASLDAPDVKKPIRYRRVPGGTIRDYYYCAAQDRISSLQISFCAIRSMTRYDSMETVSRISQDLMAGELAQDFLPPFI